MHVSRPIHNVQNEVLRGTPKSRKALTTGQQDL